MLISHNFIINICMDIDECIRAYYTAKQNKTKKLKIPINHQTDAESQPKKKFRSKGSEPACVFFIPCSYKTATSPVNYDHQQQYLSVHPQAYNDDGGGSDDVQGCVCAAKCHTQQIQTHKSAVDQAWRMSWKQPASMGCRVMRMMMWLRWVWAGRMRRWWWVGRKKHRAESSPGRDSLVEQQRTWNVVVGVVELRVNDVYAAEHVA